MKKSLALLSLAGVILLASCQQKTDTTKRSDNPSEANRTALKLDLVDSGSLIKTVSDQADYVTVKTATNVTDTLFYFTTDLTEVLEEHGTLNKSINIKPLAFTTNITSAEQSALASYLYSEDGIVAKNVGFTISSDLSSWETKVSVEAVAKDYVDSKANYSISVIYVPTLVTHYATSYTALECYVMFPLYYQIYKDGAKEAVFDSKATNLTDTLEFENDVLKSKTTEVSA